MPEGHLLLSTTNTLHQQGGFTVVGDTWRGGQTLAYANCGARLVDPAYIEDNWLADMGRRKCKRCFRV